MQEWEDTASPAVSVLPAVFLVLVASIVVSVCYLQSAKARRGRTSEFRRLQRLAIEEQERAEAEEEEEYRRQKQAEAYKLDFRRRASEEFNYRRRSEAESEQRRQGEAEYYKRRQAEIEEHQRKEAEIEEYRRIQAEVEAHQRKQAEVEAYQRKQAEVEAYQRKQAEVEAYQRKQAEVEAYQRKQAEVEAYQRKQAEVEAYQRKQAEVEDSRRRQAEEEERKAEAEENRKRQVEAQEFRRKQVELEQVKRRHAEIEAQLKKETEELSRRRYAQDEFLRKKKEGQAREHAVANGTGQKKGQTVANLYCVVCQKPTKRRCARCKNVHYCSRQCQVQHWNEGHKLECRPAGSSSPASSESDNRNFSDFLSPRSTRSENFSDTLSVDGRVAPGLSPGFSLYANSPNVSFSAPASPHSGSLLKTSSSVSADGRRLKPKKVLFTYHHFIELFNWEINLSPCGLINCGNSCFANVVLQCLTFTHPLTAYLFEGGHSESCKRTDWCFLCELQNHVWKVRQSESPFSPINIVSQIQNIGNHLGYGKQEDAHEFMRFAIDSMQSIFLDGVGGEKAVDGLTQETTLIHYIFGGRLQSKVQCLQCLYESNRYENMMDLAVGIQGNVASLEDALTQFTAPEMLEGDNKYKCDRCKTYVGASKRLTVHEAPNILTIALKRFKSGRFGKLNKQVTFPEVLDMSPYMSENGNNPQPYKLYAVVVHVDTLNASYFGHYVCYVKNAHGSWFQVDDAKVKEVDLEKVASQRAYMLMYTRSVARPATFTNSPLAQAPPAAKDISVVVPLERQQSSLCSPSVKVSVNGSGFVHTPSIKIHTLVSDAVRTLSVENVATYGDGSEFLRNDSAHCLRTDRQVRRGDPLNGEALKAQGNMAAVRCIYNDSGRPHEDLGSNVPLSLLKHSSGLSESVVTSNKFVAVSQESPVQFAEYGEAVDGRVEHSFCIPEQRMEFTESLQQLLIVEHGLQEVEEEGLSGALLHVDGLNLDLVRPDESPIDQSRTGCDVTYATGTIDPRPQLSEGAYPATRQVGMDCRGSKLDVENKIAAAAVDSTDFVGMTGVQMLPEENLVSCSKNTSHSDKFSLSGSLTSVSSETLLTSTTSELIFDSQVEVVKLTGDIGGIQFDPQEFRFKKGLPVELTGIANSTLAEKDSCYGPAKLKSEPPQGCGVSKTQEGLQMIAEKKHPSLRSGFAGETSSKKCSGGSCKATETTAHDREEDLRTSKHLSAPEWEESDINGAPKQLLSYEQSAASSNLLTASEHETSTHQMDVHSIEGEAVQVKVTPIEGQMEGSAVSNHKRRPGSPRIEGSTGVPHRVSKTSSAGSLFVSKDDVEIHAFSRVSARTFSGRLSEGCGRSCVCGSQQTCCGRGSVIMGDLALRRLVV